MFVLLFRAKQIERDLTEIGILGVFVCLTEKKPIRQNKLNIFKIKSFR